ncbi:MAG: hypothetical protein JEZ12_03585 [Desulfobacterium sp.]|nr:hypothetical protein [Desulfobacterium sp.]
MLRTRIAIMAGVFLFFVSAAPGFSYTEPVMADYTSYPIFLTETVEPNILILLDNSGSMNFNAYGAWPGNGGTVSDSYGGAPYNSLVVAVSSSDDDAEERLSDGYSYYSNNDLDIGRDIDATYPDMLIGIRFQSLKIPQGATIKSAHVEFTTHGVYANPQADITIAIHGEDINNAEDYDDSSHEISGRTATSASVNWTVTPWNTVDETHNTPELKTIIQEIVDRDDWAEGNAISLKLTNPSGSPGSGRMAYSRDASSDKAPKLHIEIDQKSATRYYGYFNPDYFYSYTSNLFSHKYKKVEYIGDPSSGGYWKVENLSGTPHNLYDTEIVTSGLWDGNWMNWCAMRRVDILRKVLMGGLATSRTGGGNQTNICETPDQSDRDFIRHFDSTNNAAVSPYDGDYYYEMNDGYIYVDTDSDPSDGGTSYTLKVQKEKAYEPEDFHNYDSGDNLAGILQRYGDKARWGNEFFNNGTGNGESGGYIAATIGTNMTSLITDLQNTPCNTYTPLAEAYYVATQYFKQEAVQSGLDYPNNVIPAANVGDDPYHNGTEFVSCAKSFVILLTDGASTMDSKIPASLKDFDNDGKDITSCDESSSDCSYGNGSDFLDDIALYARTTDLRSSTVGKTELDGDQNLILYTVYAMGDDDDARQLLKDAARNGSFEDRDGDNKPDGDYTDPPEDRLEWDKDGDAIPDTYFEARDGYKLEEALGAAITDILRRAASGTSVSIISSATEGEGNVIQAYFRPNVPSPSGPGDIKWVGSLQSLWIDPYGNMREDSNMNKTLDLSADKILNFVDQGGDTKVERYDVSSTPYPDYHSAAVMPADTVNLTEVLPIWEAGSNLESRVPSTRKIFTYLDMDGDGVVDEGNVDGEVDSGDDPFDDSGELVRFNTDIPAIKPYLGVESNAAWSNLGLTHGDRFNNIINFIRGTNTGFQGSALIRDRNLTGIAGSSWKLGDIVHSSPILVTTPYENYDLLYGDESYFKYYSEIGNRETVIYVGGNDGMIHAFTSWQYDAGNMQYIKPSGTTESIGDELWAYIPQALLPHLKWLPSQSYTHVYYNDLKLKAFDAKILPDDTHYSDTDSDDNWGTFILAGMNFGGRHIWANGDFDDGSGTVTNETRHFYPSYSCLDITDPRNPRLLWERSYAIPASPGQTADNDTDMGLSTSYPAIIKVGEKWFAVFGSGPDNFEGTSSTKGHIFVVDLKTGEPHQNGTDDWLFETDENDAFMAHPASFDKNMNFNVDSIYIGETYDNSAGVGFDWKGALYRIRVPFKSTATPCTYGDMDCGIYIDDPNDGTNPWTISKMFDSPAPITAAPTLSLDNQENTWTFFGTGRYISEADELNTDQQYIFGLKDPFFNSEHGTGADASFNDGYYQNTGSSLTLTQGNLRNTDDFIVLDNGEVYANLTTSFGNFSDLEGEVENHDGWEREIYYSGERVIKKAAIIGGTVLASSFIPNSDICGFGGSSYIYGLYYKTGTAYKNPAFKGGIKTVVIDGDPEDKVVDMISLGDGLASSPGVHVGKQKDGKVTAFIQTSKGFIETEEIDPALKMRSGIKAWREKE